MMIKKKGKKQLDINRIGNNKLLDKKMDFSTGG